MSRRRLELSAALADSGWQFTVNNCPKKSNRVAMKKGIKSAQLIVLCVWLCLAAIATVVMRSSSSSVSRAAVKGDEDNDDMHAENIDAQVVATGIPGAGAIAQVGTFQQGGPFHDNSSSVPFTHRARFSEPNLHAVITDRIVMGNMVIDHEQVTRTFSEGAGTMEAVAIYEVRGDEPVCDSL